MRGIVLQIACFVAILAAVEFLPGAAAAVNVKASKRPTTSIVHFNGGSPCDGVTCLYGRRCAVNENDEASCVCDAECPPDGGGGDRGGGGGKGGGGGVGPSSQVCGSDNRTYSSNCALTREACTTNTTIYVMYFGQCHDVGFYCGGVTCPSDRECAVADNRATCVCIQTCASFSDPVCGSDNKTYVNDCYLRRHSCISNDNITIAYTGECNKEMACARLKCGQGMHCAVKESRRPVCVCLDECPDPTDTNIVCGTDGRTYGNECELYKEACTSAKHFRLAYKGFCLEGSVCRRHRCPSDRQCSVDQNNLPVCVCIQSCLNNYDPVCGSDGITYQNLCDFQRLTCVTRTNVTVVRTGQCSYDQYCSGVVCPGLMSCYVDAQNQTSCACNSQCNDYYYPVCGSDNQTHINYCQMNTAACTTNNTITGLYDGACSTGPKCEEFSCGVGMHCDSRHQSEPRCVCDTVCPNTGDPLCGSNNKTYQNNCELQRDACLTNTSITVQFNRRCAEGPGCDFTSCPYDQICVVDKRNRAMCVCSQSCYSTTYEVCGSDNKTYTNECFLTVAACMTKTNITMLHSGQCEEDNPCTGVVCSADRYCDLDAKGRPICVCNEDCNGLGSPVCGSDNKTYGSYCELRREACLSGSNIRWLYYGQCAEASVCDGVPCSPDKKCAVDEHNQPTCVCLDECLSVEYPVCGSDGRNYVNECELQKVSCMLEKNVTLAYRGRCGQGLTCSDINCPWDRKCALNEANQPTCVCNTDCSSFFFTYPVCGTDGKTYENECYLQMEACTTDSNVEVDYDGPCGDDASGATSADA